MAPEKTELAVVVYTAQHRIEGLLTLLKGEHLSDKLNVGERRFEAIREAKVFALADGRELHASPYLAVNKDNITMMIPAQED
jgi:hypothetical protein